MNAPVEIPNVLSGPVNRRVGRFFAAKKNG